MGPFRLHRVLLYSPVHFFAMQQLSPSHRLAEILVIPLFVGQMLLVLAWVVLGFVEFLQWGFHLLFG